LRTMRLIWIALCVAALACSLSCGSVCGLAQHARVTAEGTVPCCGASEFKDVALGPTRGASEAEFDLSNTAMPVEPGPVDAFLVPASCTKLFDGPYPGAAAQCQIYLGPTAPGKVSARVKLAAGTYRIWIQGYTSTTAASRYLADVTVWDESCQSPLLK